MSVADGECEKLHYFLLRILMESVFFFNLGKRLLRASMITRK